MPEKVIDRSPGPGLGNSSRVFRVGAMAVQRRPNGGESRNVLQGKLRTGEEVAVHESVQPQGATPNPPHRIEHTELICMAEGALEFLHDGKVERAEAGDVLPVAYGTLHGVRNVGTGPVKYFVIALGGDTNQK